MLLPPGHEHLRGLKGRGTALSDPTAAQGGLCRVGEWALLCRPYNTGT